jgi:hypothetical protein
LRNDEQLVQSALGLLERSVDFAEPPELRGPFKIHHLLLPERFHGKLPPMWKFAVLTHSPLQRGDLQEVILPALATIVKSYPYDGDPLVFLSDYPQIRLYDQLPLHPRIFALDHHELPGGRPRNEIAPRQTPLAFAVKRRLDHHDSRKALCPYVRDKPALKWRFFGRKKELERLVHSDENYMVIGARRIGKTSLVRQVQIELQRRGVEVVFVDAQAHDNEKELSRAIMQKFSMQDFQQLERRNQLTEERFLELALKRARSGRRVVLIIDELGNVLERLKSDAWRVLGLLRAFAQSDQIRIIGTGFQEFFLKQQEDYSGPWVNFSSTLRLGGFRDQEIDEFVIEPLQMWSEVSNPRQIRDTVLSTVGRHPMLLQYFCEGVYMEVARRSNPSLIDSVRDIIGTQMMEVFAEPIENIFYRVPSSILRYLFLFACHEGELRQKPIHQVEIDDDWIENVLNAAGYSSTTGSRRNLLEGLEVRGLTQPVGGDRGVQVIVTPIVYRFIKRAFNVRSETQGIQKLLMKYKAEIDGELDAWRLTRNSVS